MENTTTTNALALSLPGGALENLQQDLLAIYDQNKTSLQRARAAGLELLELNLTEIDADTDRQLEDYLVRARKTVALMRERREPFTKLFDQIRATFVELEASLDPKKAGSITAQLQEFRDTYAAYLRELELKRQREIQERAAAAQRALEEERRLREQAEQLADEHADQAQRQQLEAEAERLHQEQQQQAQEVEQLTAQVLPEQPKGRTGIQVTITDPTAYVALLSIYLEREHRTLAQLEKLTLGQLKTYAERLALSSGEVLDHPGIIYAETFKTVAR